MKNPKFQLQKVQGVYKPERRHRSPGGLESAWLPREGRSARLFPPLQSWALLGTHTNPDTGAGLQNELLISSLSLGASFFAIKSLVIKEHNSEPELNKG